MKRQKNGKFAKGNEGGPGRPELSQREKELRALNQNEVKHILNEFLQLTPYQLKQKRDDPETRMVELFVISIITHGTNKGDPIRLNFLFDRLIGKMKETIDVMMRPFENLGDDELKRRIEALERRASLPPRAQ